MTKNLESALEAEVLAQELERFAQRLRNGTCPQSEPVELPSRPRKGSRGGRNSYVDLAKRLYRARRAREAFLPGEMLGEPMWDMLLDLYVAQVEGREVTVTSLQIASCVPGSTSLRWMGLMEDKGLIERRHAAHDRRVQYLKLTTQGARAMQQYLSEIEDVDRLDGGAFLFRVK